MKWIFILAISDWLVENLSAREQNKRNMAQNEVTEENPKFVI